MHGLDPARILCGAGSDEVIAFLTQAYAGPGREVIHSRHGFGMYRISALAAGATPVEVREAERHTDVDAILAACSDRTALVFLADPNNPTGTMIAASEVARLAAGLPPQALLVLDGAYADFVPGFDGHAGLVDARDNVVMTRTFSKIYGLGGLRVGWGYAPAHVIDVLNRLRGPFNLSTTALVTAEAAVRDTAHTAMCRDENTRNRQALAAALEAPASRPIRPRPTSSSPASATRPRRRPATAHSASAGSSSAGRRASSCRMPAHHRRRRRGLRARRRGSRRLRPGARLMRYRHVALIGLGLIASSISHAIRRTGAPVRITGYARTAETRAEAARLGLAEIRDTAAEAVAGADLVVLCVPVGAMEGVASEIAPSLKPGATVSDVGSVKRAVISAVAPHIPVGVHFIPGHPLAGTEHSGPAPASPSSSTTAGAC